MALTLLQLRTLTKQMVGNRTSPTITDSWYTDRIVSGYRRLCSFQGVVAAPGVTKPQMRQLGFFELEDRTSRTLTTALASNFVTPSGSNIALVLDVYDATNNVPLGAMNEREMRSLDPDATGRPTKWMPGGKSGAVGYYLDKRPAVSADELTVYEWTQKYPAALAADGDSPIIPEDWHVAIVYAAAKEAALLMDMPEKTDEMEGRFINYIAERWSPKELAGKRGRSGPRRYTPVGTSWRY